MSTKATIISNNNLHVYEEVFDENNIFIDIENTNLLKLNILGENNKITISFNKNEFKIIAKEFLKSVGEKNNEHIDLR